MKNHFQMVGNKWLKILVKYIILITTLVQHLGLIQEYCVCTFDMSLIFLLNDHLDLLTFLYFSFNHFSFFTKSLFFILKIAPLYHKQK